jgi:hypothetical protein
LGAGEILQSLFVQKSHARLIEKIGIRANEPNPWIIPDRVTRTGMIWVSLSNRAWHCGPQTKLLLRRKVPISTDKLIE